MTCNHQCRQGRDCTCAITAFYAETEGVMPMPAGCSLKALPVPLKPCTPFPPIDLPEEFDPLDIGLAGALLIGFVVLICSGISAYLVAQLAVRMPF